jgi:hypothetical protein
VEYESEGDTIITDAAESIEDHFRSIWKTSLVHTQFRNVEDSRTGSSTHLEKDADVALDLLSSFFSVKRFHNSRVSFNVV